MIESPAAGLLAILNPLSLPVHPLIVHFPIAALTAVWVGLVARYALGKTSWEPHLMFLELVGVATLPFTIGLGFVDTRGAEFLLERNWDQPLIWHFIVAMSAAAVFSGHFMWRRRQAANRSVAVAWDLGLASAGMWLLLMTGLIAGEMVYA